MSGWILIILMSWSLNQTAEPHSVRMNSQAECEQAAAELIRAGQELTAPRIAAFCIKGAQ